MLRCSLPVDAAAFFSARFSLIVLPDFLLALCRGDLSAMVGSLNLVALPHSVRALMARAEPASEAVSRTILAVPAADKHLGAERVSVLASTHENAHRQA